MLTLTINNKECTHDLCLTLKLSPCWIASQAINILSRSAQVALTISCSTHWFFNFLDFSVKFVGFLNILSRSAQVALTISCSTHWFFNFLDFSVKFVGFLNILSRSAQVVLARLTLTHIPVTKSSKVSYWSIQEDQYHQWWLMIHHFYIELSLWKLSYIWYVMLTRGLTLIVSLWL